MQKLVELSTNFRAAIEQAKYDGRFAKDQCFRNFPNGCCGIASELLGRYLSDFGFNITYVCGTYYVSSPDERQSHAWLEINGEIIVDITGDQFRFNQDLMCFNIPVYVGKSNRFYKLFEVNQKFVCDSRRPLCSEYIRSHMTEKELYEIILEYIG